jgi:predicted ATPase
VTHRGELERDVYRTPLPSGLPRPPTSFVGRERELGMIARLLDETHGPSGPRLVTLTGAPGAGKTRLAIEAGTQLAAGATFDRISFVDLSQLAPGQAQQMLSLVGQALGLLPVATDDLVGRITEHLAESRALLLIDNFEHVLEAATDLAELLERSPGTRTLVTSQRPLGYYFVRYYVNPDV